MLVTLTLVIITSKPCILATQLSYSDIPFSYGIKSFGFTKFWLLFDFLLDGYNVCLFLSLIFQANNLTTLFSGCSQVYQLMALQCYKQFLFFLPVLLWYLLLHVLHVFSPTFIMHVLSFVCFLSIHFGL